MNKVGELCVAFISKNANIDLRVTENVIVVNHFYGILSFIWYKYELCRNSQGARKPPRQRTICLSGACLERFSCRSELRPALFISYAFRRH